MRWKVGVREYLETYEHRVVDGYVTTAEEVHHRNRIRDDNSPANLVPMSSTEHHRHHAGKIPVEDVIRLYQQGVGTPSIGRMLGFDTSAVYRVLRRKGVPTRPKGSVKATRLDVDLDQIRRMHAQGIRVSVMAERLGVSRTAVDLRMKELGLRPFPPGPSPRKNLV